MKIRWTECKVYMEEFPQGAAGAVKPLCSTDPGYALIYIAGHAKVLRVPTWKYKQLLDQKKVRVNAAYTLKQHLAFDAAFLADKQSGKISVETRFHDEVDPNQHIKQEDTKRAQAEPSATSRPEQAVSRLGRQVGQRPEVRREVRYDNRFR